MAQIRAWTSFSRLRTHYTRAYINIFIYVHIYLYVYCSRNTLSAENGLLTRLYDSILRVTRNIIPRYKEPVMTRHVYAIVRHGKSVKIIGNVVRPATRTLVFGRPDVGPSLAKRTNRKNVSRNPRARPALRRDAAKINSD